MIMRALARAMLYGVVLPLILLATPIWATVMMVPTALSAFKHWRNR